MYEKKINFIVFHKAARIKNIYFYYNPVFSLPIPLKVYATQLLHTRHGINSFFCNNITLIIYTMLKLKGLNCSSHLIITKSIIDAQSSWQVRGGGNEYNFCSMAEWGNLHLFSIKKKKKKKIRSEIVLNMSPRSVLSYDAQYS